MWSLVPYANMSKLRTYSKLCTGAQQDKPEDWVLLFFSLLNVMFDHLVHPIPSDLNGDVVPLRWLNRVLKQPVKLARDLGVLYIHTAREEGLLGVVRDTPI
jgi:hypothetical protein